MTVSGILDTMGIAFALLFGVFIGFVIGVLLCPRPTRKEIKLIMAMQLDATQPIKITAVGRDSEGNSVDLVDTDLTISAEATEGNFGEINDEMDTFNPGEAGATGVIRGEVTIDGEVYSAEVEVELVAGGLDSISLKFTPAES